MGRVRWPVRQPFLRPALPSSHAAVGLEASRSKAALPFPVSSLYLHPLPACSPRTFRLDAEQVLRSLSIEKKPQ